MTVLQTGEESNDPSDMRDQASPSGNVSSQELEGGEEEEPDSSRRGEPSDGPRNPFLAGIALKPILALAYAAHFVGVMPANDDDLPSEEVA